jgi:ankyrin repeat protein
MRIHDLQAYRTSLLKAIESDSERRVQGLLQAGTDIKLDEEGKTALHYAVTFNSAKIVKTIIKAGADLNTADIHDKTPLDYAIELGHEECAQIIQKHLQQNKENTVQKRNILDYTKKSDITHTK